MIGDTYMKINIREKEFQIWAIFSAIIILLWLIFIFNIINNKMYDEKTFLDTELKRFQGEIHSTLATYQSFSNYIFDETTLDKEVMSIMYQANTASDEEKAILRDRLYKKLYKKYETMKKYEFRQFHFHLPSTESFLRIHAPKKYGDILSDVRESVRLVNENRSNVIGFEEGKIFNGFRHVYPLSYNDEHIGSLEISISSASIIEVLSKLYTDEHIYFIIDKDNVKESLFDEEMKNYRDSYIAENYYVDSEVDKIRSKHNKVIPKPEELFFKGLREQSSERLKDKESFAMIYKFKDKDYIVKFSAFKNFKKASVAYLISISESSEYGKFAREMYKEIILVTPLALLLITFSLGLFFYQYRLKENGEIDYLTKIYNRSKFYEVAEKELKSAKRYSYPVTLMMLDIDYFKKINDSYGHKWGDGVLKEMVGEISKNIRGTDVFARWGGEEFIFLLPHTEKSNAIKVAEKIRKVIDGSDSEKLKEVTVSIGIAEVDLEDPDIDKIINLADKAMYRAKENGRNQVSL